MIDTVGYKNWITLDSTSTTYVPLQMVRAVDSSSFQPKIAKTRYGMVNPFAGGIDKRD